MNINVQIPDTRTVMPNPTGAYAWKLMNGFPEITSGYVTALAYHCNPSHDDRSNSHSGAHSKGHPNCATNSTIVPTTVSTPARTPTSASIATLAPTASPTAVAADVVAQCVFFDEAGEDY